MAVNTIGVTDIMFFLAQELKEWRSDYVTTVNSATDLIALRLTEKNNDAYKYGLARIEGKGTSVVQSYNGTSKQLTFSPAFSPTPVVGDTIELAWWKGDKRAQAFAAIQHSTRLAWPYWYRETISAAPGAFVANTHTYDLGSISPQVDALIAVGIQSSSNPIHWVFAEENDGRINWQIVGEQGAYQVRYPRFGRKGTLADTFAGQTPYYWYATREPAPATETAADIRLPLDFYQVAAELMRRRQMNTVTAVDVQRFGLNLPQLQAAVRDRLQFLGIAKPNMLLRPRPEGAMQETKKEK